MKAQDEKARDGRIPGEETGYGGADFLRHVAIFSLLEGRELDSLAGFLHAHEIDAGHLLFREGDEGNELFIVKSGSVAVTVGLGNGVEQQVAEFRAGDFFGEMSIFEDAPRSASCRIKERSRLLSLHERDFFHLMENHPLIAIKLMRKMLTVTTKRLMNTSEFVSDMVEWGENARRRAITDELTGIYNRRFLDDSLGSYFEEAERGGRPLSLIMIDLDRFREINERFGHEAGDRVIVEAAAIFRRSIRERDVAARYGGDEFTIILPDTPLEDARDIAEAIRSGAEKLPALEHPEGGSIRVTTSQGVASFPDHGGDLATVRAKADEALYRAKESGRNRVVCASRAGTGGRV